MRGGRKIVRDGAEAGQGDSIVTLGTVTSEGVSAG